MADYSVTSGSINDLDPEPEPQPQPQPQARKVRKVKRTKSPAAPEPGTEPEPERKPSESYPRAALPGGRIPDIRSELDILGKGVGAIRFADKADSIIVPTVLPGFNRAIRCGGAPMNCIAAIHGPSKGGKTAFCLALMRSFQLQAHFGVYIDAEHTLDKRFVSECGVDPSQMEYVAPLTYEETTSKVEQYIKNFRDGRDKGKIHPNRCLLFVVDSINKLVPENELEELSKVGKGYPLRALMNTVWLDRLTPIVGSLPILFVALAHEKVKVDAKPFEKKYRVKGGEGLIYDSTMVIRIQVVGTKKRTVGGTKVVAAQICEGRIEKNKVGIASDRFRFVMGQGRAGYPIGFDYCEAVVEEARLRGDNSPIVRATGGVWRHGSLPDGRIKGDAALVDFLRENPDTVDLLISELNDTAIEAVVSDDSEEDED